MRKLSRTGLRGSSNTNKKPKYNNKKVGEFDSMKERNRFEHLKLEQKAGLIANLEHHVVYELIPQQIEYIRQYSKKDPAKELKPKKRVLEQNVEYEADFVYVDLATMETVVEDSKGVRTPDYVIKRKLMLERYGIKIKET